MNSEKTLSETENKPCDETSESKTSADPFPYVLTLESHNKIFKDQRYSTCHEHSWSQENTEHDRFVPRVAATAEEACKLVEAGFEFVCETNGTNIFRKRK